MFDQMSAPTAWYRSWPTLVVASLLLPPLGIILLLMRRDVDVKRKVLGSLCVAALGAGYLYLFSSFSRDPDAEAHYAALEHHREQQRQQTPPEVVQAPTAGQPAVLTLPDQQPTPGSNVEPAQMVAPAATASQDANHTSAPAGAQTTAANTRRNYWTNFRGPRRDGRYDEQVVKTTWGPEGLPLLWRQPIGGGYASFVIADGVAYTIEQRRAQETVAAYNIGTGRELWTHGWNGEFRESMGGDGPRATPTWDDGRLYALGAEGELRCLDAKSGKLIWSRNILTDNGATNLQWGMAASPLIVDDKVVVLPGGASGKSVVAYNKLTGAPVWKSFNDQASYTSPMLVTLAGRRQILVVTARRIVGLTPEDGSMLWDYPWSNSASINISQPIVVNQNRFFISAGYGKGAALVEVSGSGKSFSAAKVWESSSMKNKFNSSVLHEGHIYGLDEGILSCVDVATGERKWKGGRYGYGQVLLASGHLIVTTETGEIVLVKASPDQHAEVARFSALEGRTWNNPAIAQGRLLVRNTTQMACYKLTD